MVEGYLGLFLSAFLAATVLPFSSEAVLVGLAVSGEFSTGWLFAVAATGNVLGSVVNWLLGRFCLRWRDRRWFPVKEPALARATRLFNRWGVVSLLFAWMPVVGDPLTFMAGVLRTPFLVMVVLVTIGKAGRYAVLLGLVDRLG
ncbi:MAG: YqaA family protein [Rhodospirillales bacterium]|jgi:membrane protein YqaA with SNARE-associated domain|nr:YqaA family protein [Rhodospirillales bacterium]